MPSTKPDIRRSRSPIQKKNHSIRATFHTAWALNDRPPFSGRPSLTGHCGHGWTCSLPHPVTIDTRQPRDSATRPTRDERHQHDARGAVILPLFLLRPLDHALDQLRIFDPTKPPRI